MNRIKFGAFSLLVVMASNLFAARWNPKTTDWSRNPRPVIGDWGFDRPGYPKGLYIHGITVKEGKAVRNAVIYDNDVYDDVFEDEWMYAMASLGRLRLVGQIVTPVLTDGWGFYHDDWVQTGLDAMERAKQSGIDMTKLPPITVGTIAPSEKEGERKSSDAAKLYVELINKEYKKNPELPVIVNIGGQAASLASAWCIDPSIADKCIVYYTDLKVYNGHYEWASKLVAKHFRIINWGQDEHWWHNKKYQTDWNVLPRPAFPQAEQNDENSGEWRLLTEKHLPMLDHMVHQFRNRNEYSQKEDQKGDAYGDGTFLHAWLPGIFGDAEIQEMRDGEAIQVTCFNEAHEALVKQFTLSVLLNDKAYKYKR